MWRTARIACITCGGFLRCVPLRPTETSSGAYNLSAIPPKTNHTTIASADCSAQPAWLAPTYAYRVHTLGLRRYRQPQPQVASNGYKRRRARGAAAFLLPGARPSPGMYVKPAVVFTPVGARCRWRSDELLVSGFSPRTFVRTLSGNARLGSGGRGVAQSRSRSRWVDSPDLLWPYCDAILRLGREGACVRYQPAGIASAQSQLAAALTKSRLMNVSID